VILGCGVDLMEVARFEREVARRGDGLIDELFSAAERSWCRRRRRAAEGYAMGYAAKEALFKALGTGKVGRMAWHDVEIAWPEGTAQPTVTLAGESGAVAAAMGVSAVHLATALTKTLAVAWVVVTGFGTRDSGFVCHTETNPSSSTTEPPEPQIPTNVGERTRCHSTTTSSDAT
jgi:holo-[acyl-carrier protein] synthase